MQLPPPGSELRHSGRKKLCSAAQPSCVLQASTRDVHGASGKVSVRGRFTHVSSPGEPLSVMLLTLQSDLPSSVPIRSQNFEVGNITSARGASLPHTSQVLKPGNACAIRTTCC